MSLCLIHYRCSKNISYSNKIINGVGNKSKFEPDPGEVGFMEISLWPVRKLATRKLGCAWDFL